MGEPIKSKFRQRLDEAVAALTVIETLGIAVEAINLAPERVSIQLQSDSHHPRLNGLFRGEMSDATGRWCIYESSIGSVVVRWLTSRNRRVCR